VLPALLDAADHADDALARSTTERNPIAAPACPGAGPEIKMNGTRIERSRWLSPAHQRPARDGVLRLVCFPFAGGTAQIFHAWDDWARRLPVPVELCPVQLPGRGQRINEPAHRSIATLVEDACTGLAPHLRGRFALFGHSMGAVVGFELARLLRVRHGLVPEQLFVSAHRTPGLALNRPAIHGLPDAELITELVRMRGTPEDIAGNAELMALLLPMLRADFEAIERYAAAPAAPLDCPITAFGGQDDALIPRADLEGWRAQTTRRFALHMLPGDHFFVTTHRQPLLDALAAELCRTPGARVEAA
jgi:medium-chain acyl-[acyl-carrier-protein] hydrolase